MNTTSHELAALLRQIANALRKGPNISAADAIESILSGDTARHPVRSIKPRPTKNDLPIALSALVSLSSIDKSEWIALINDLGINIEVRPRDASRDIMGKVLKILENEPDVRSRLQLKVKNKEAEASPELARALSSLLQD